MRNVLLAILLLPGLANADLIEFQIRHVYDQAGTGYVVIRAAPTDVVAKAIMEVKTGNDCIVNHDSAFTKLSGDWQTISDAMAANHFVLTTEQQNFCTDAAIPPPPPPAPPPVLTARGQVYTNTSPYPGQPIMQALAGTVCAQPTYIYNGVTYYTVTLTTANGTRTGIAICQ